MVKQRRKGAHFVAVVACTAMVGACVARSGAEPQAAPGSPTWTEARFDETVTDLEGVILEPQRVAGSRRHDLRRSLDFLVRYLEAQRPSEEIIVILQRRLDDLKALRTGVVIATPEVYAADQAALDRAEARIVEQIQRLRDFDDASISAEKNSDEVLARAPAARGQAQRPNDTIAALERLVLPAGRLDAATKQRLRRRLDPMLAFLEAPLTRAEVLADLREQLDALARFGSVGSVDGSHELFARYKAVLAKEEIRLREQIRRVEQSND